MSEFSYTKETAANLIYYPFDIESIAEQLDISVERAKEELFFTDEGIRLKNQCYSDYDLGRLQILIVMLVGLSPKETFDEMKKKKNIEKRLMNTEFSFKTLR